MKTLLDSADPNGHNPQGICLNKVKDWWGLMLRQRLLLFKSLLLICQSNQRCRDQCSRFWCRLRGGGWLRRAGRNLTPQQENSWEWISSVGKGGGGWGGQDDTLEGKVQTGLLWLSKSSTVPKDSQASQTVNNRRCSSNLTNPGTSRGFMNNLWYPMSAHKWKWSETWGLGGNLMLPLVKKLYFLFLLKMSHDRG